MVANFYRTKKLVQGLGLPIEKIDCCKNSCMIYYGEDVLLTSCKFCNHPRFKNKCVKPGKNRIFLNKGKIIICRYNKG